VDLFVFIIIVIVFVTTNSMDFHCCSSSFHICLLPSMVVPQPLETWYHSPSWSFAFAISYVSLMELVSVMHKHSASLPVLMLALQMVPLSFSSSFGPLPMCFPVPFWPLLLRFHLIQLYSSSLKHPLEILLQFFFCFPMLLASLLWFFWP
jgi:hypothetical protein